MSNNKQTPIEKAIDLIDGFLTELDDIAESNNKQSSIQQFWDKIALKLSVEQINEFLPLFEQAKAMHEVEIRMAFYDGQLHEGTKSAIEYYNETFGGNNEQQ